jgi:hypothetical protein
MSLLGFMFLYYNNLQEKPALYLIFISYFLFLIDQLNEKSDIL